MRIIVDGNEYQLNASEEKRVRELMKNFEQEKTNEYYSDILNKALDDKRKNYQPKQQETPHKLPQDFRGLIHY